jgi:TM2 domain-containing membrane protein YozV
MRSKDNMNKSNKQLILSRTLALILFSILFPSLAQAYVGPGAGLSAIGTILAFVGSILLLVVGFVWYPIKRLFRKNISQNESGSEEKVVSDKYQSDKNASVKAS